MNLLKSLIPILLFGILFYSCENSNDEIQSPIYPANIGNKWIYEETTSANTPNTEIVQSEVKYQYTIGGVKGFSFIEYAEGEPISMINSDNEGNCIEYLFNKNTLVNKTIAFKKNVKKGDKWVYKPAVYTGSDYSKYKIEEREITCIASDTVIVTPKGSFHCIGYRSHPGGFDSEGLPYHTMFHYLSENVGLVKQLHYEHDNGRTTLFKEKVLTDYYVK